MQVAIFPLHEPKATTSRPSRDVLKPVGEPSRFQDVQPAWFPDLHSPYNSGQYQPRVWGDRTQRGSTPFLPLKRHGGAKKRMYRNAVQQPDKHPDLFDSNHREAHLRRNLLKLFGRKHQSTSSQLRVTISFPGKARKERVRDSVTVVEMKTEIPLWREKRDFA